MEDKQINEKKTEESKNARHVLQLVLVLFIGIGLGLFGRFRSQNNGIAPTSSSNLSRFDQVYETIQDSWVNTGEEDIDLEAAAIKGFLENIGDPHTTYFTNEQLKNFTSAVEGSFAGIGVSYSMRENGGLISSVMEETPASEAGFKAGDIITAVDGTSIIGLTSNDVKALVTGEEGTSVTLTILRDGKEMALTAVRRKIDSSVTYEKREANGKQIGYLDINTFGDMTDQSIKKALNFFKENGIETIVIDLRDNTGGYLSSVQNILSLFLPKDTVLFSLEQKSGPAQSYRSVSDENYTFKQGYILVNGETASASEVMAGALSELLEYQLVGKNTYGKGTAQTQLMLSDMSSIKYTYARWLLPSGKCINGVGLAPDIEVDAPALSDFYSIVLDEGQTIVADTVSEQCLEMQKMLKTIGYDPGREDGYFSAGTQQALESFEKDHGLSVDGIFDANDNQELVNALITYFNDLAHDACYQKVLEEMR